MARYRLLTMVNSKPQREGEMNTWYDTAHLPDLLNVPGVVAAERWRILNPIVPTDPLCRYINVFEIEAEDPNIVLAEIRRRSAAGQNSVSDAFQLVSMGIYEAVTQRRTP